jgi:hypothetical protein
MEIGVFARLAYAGASQKTSGSNQFSEVIVLDRQAVRRLVLVCFAFFLFWWS